ncbi:MAG: GTPase domain-containing protein [Pirellulales bacterium]|nr:GTPase domain-containing protein [Pirellulales bacterium]
MPEVLKNWADRIRRLALGLAELEPIGVGVGVPSPVGQHWLELLRRKLLVELEDEPLLVVAVVGGTNIGKSVLFNHLGGETASGASPLAAGTRHPVCLVPPDLTDPARLGRLFDKFELQPWHSADDPLRDSDAHRLFWRAGKNVPDRLLLLDTPDVDSDVQVNWERARAIRQAADVLIAVLTQQKYNDAAVKQFFREAVEADKPIVVVFNQCDIEADREYWPQWLATFAGQIGAQPQLVYVVPADRRAAEELRLPFYRVGPDGQDLPGEASDLRRELGQLEFDTIKIRTFRGALARVLDPEQGAPSYLRAIRAASGEFAAAAEALSASEIARVAWPTLPPAILVDEIRDWWDADRADWSRRVHGFYRRLGRGVLWPIRAVGTALSPGTSDPRETIRRQERAAIVQAVKSLLDELDRLAQVGNDTLRPRLLALLGGTARAELLAQVEAAHEELETVDEGYRKVLRGELEAWKSANPRAVRFLRSLDHVAAVARPAITVSLAVSGWVVAGDLVGQAAVQAVSHTAGELATEAAIAGGITGGGEALVSSTTEGVRHAAGRLLVRLQARYAQQRAAWLASWLEAQLLGPLLDELRHGAEVPQCDAFRQVESLLQELKEGTADERG